MHPYRPPSRHWSVRPRRPCWADPTPSKQSRHLILLENAAGCRLHIQLHQDALAVRDFNKITLNWVDFD